MKKVIARILISPLSLVVWIFMKVIGLIEIAYEENNLEPESPKLKKMPLTSATQNPDVKKYYTFK